MVAALALAGIYLLSLPKSGGEDSNSIISTSGSNEEEVYSPKTALESSSSSTTNIMSKNKEQLDEEDVDPLKITLGTVTYDDGNVNLPYYHCGPLPTTTTSDNNNPNLTELILLHGAAFTKEDWKSSGILDML